MINLYHIAFRKIHAVSYCQDHVITNMLKHGYVIFEQSMQISIKAVTSSRHIFSTSASVLVVLCGCQCNHHFVCVYTVCSRHNNKLQKFLLPQLFNNISLLNF